MPKHTQSIRFNKFHFWYNSPRKYCLYYNQIHIRFNVCLVIFLYKQKSLSVERDSLYCGNWRKSYKLRLNLDLNQQCPMSNSSELFLYNAISSCFKLTYPLRFELLCTLTIHRQTWVL